MNPPKLTLARACDLSVRPGLSRRTKPWALLPVARETTASPGAGQRGGACLTRRCVDPLWAPRVLRPWEKECRCLWHSPRGAERSRQRNSRDHADAARNH